MKDDAFYGVSKKPAWEFGDYDFPDEGKQHTLKIVSYDSDRLHGSAIALNHALEKGQ